MANAYAIQDSGHHEYVTMRLGNELFGISVMAIQDVLRKQVVAPVPLAPEVIAGLINLRGRIVTAIDMRKRFGMPPMDDPKTAMHVVVEYGNDLVSLMVDSVGEVLSIQEEDLEKAPANMGSALRDVASNVYPLNGDILVILDTHNLLQMSAMTING